MANEMLWRGEDRIPLKPKTYSVLLYFVQHSQRLVTKEELLENVWRNVVVDDELLRGYVRELRQVLGDNAAAPEFIETVVRRGYRFLPQVRKESRTEVPGDTLEQRAADRHAHDANRSSAPALTVGVLHSLTGMMAWTESPVVDATLLAIDEINQRGGIRGRKINPIVADGRSDERVFAEKAAELLDNNAVAALFGCWTSASRKAVVPVVEAKDGLLLYPVQYEGMEASPNVVYTGAAPNQQIIPAVRWAEGFLRARRFFLVGWDSVYSWAAHEIVRDEATAGGNAVVGEAFLAPDGVNVPETVREIVRSEPDVIINSTVGDLNLLYSRVLRAAGVTPQTIPTIYLSVGEAELLSLTSSEAAGDYAVWSYFQTIDRPENRAFVERFRARYGSQRVTNDPMEAATIAVNLWAKAMEDAGSEEVAAVRAALGNQVYEAPEGRVNVDRETQHIWKTTRVGQVRSDNHFDILWSSEKPIRPQPFPASRPPAEWASFLADRYKAWGGRWTAPSRAPR